MNSNVPQKGRPFEEILKELDSFGKDDPRYKEAKTWSLVYYLNEEYTQFLEKAYARYFSANGLNPTAFKSLKNRGIIKFIRKNIRESSKGIGISCAKRRFVVIIITSVAENTLTFS